MLFPFEIKNTKGGERVNKKIALAVASALFLFVVLTTPMTFAQPWDEIILDAQAETITVSETVGYFSFYAISPRQGIPNNIILTGGGKEITWDLNPGDLVIVRDFVMTDLTTSSDHVLYQGPAEIVEVNGAEVIPEFPPFLILPLFMMATLLAAVVLKRKLKT